MPLECHNCWSCILHAPVALLYRESRSLHVQQVLLLYLCCALLVLLHLGPLRLHLLLQLLQLLLFLAIRQPVQQACNGATTSAVPLGARQGEVD